MHKGLDDLMAKLDTLFNRLVIALVVTGGLIGSSLIGIFAKSGPHVLGPARRVRARLPPLRDSRRVAALGRHSFRPPLMRFPGESEEYRRARDELLDAEVSLRRQIEAVAAKRRELPLGGEVPVDYAVRRRRRAGADVRALRGRQGHVVRLQLHVPSGRRRATGVRVSQLHVDHRLDRRCRAARDAAHQLRGLREGADRAVPGTRTVAGLAPCAPAVVVGQHVQPRLRRGRPGREPAPDRHSVRASRRTDPSFLEQRALHRAHRPRAASPPRGLHVAPLGDLRPCSRGARERLEPASSTTTAVDRRIV